MCSTCGCGEGEVHIEGDHDHAHDHSHEHAHAHGHPHEHSHGHDHQHPHEQGKAEAQVIHHHYHHNGNVEHHYHYHFHSAQAMQAYLHDHGHEEGCCCDGDGHGDDGCCCDGHEHKHEHQHEHFHPEESAQGDLHYGQGEAGTHAPGMTQKRMFEIEMNVLDKNNKIAMHNRDHFDAQNILVLNLVSSPGSGKTTLLTETLMRVKDKTPCAVIEGDQQTSNDADRIRATGVPAIQVNTGKGCHLDAQMVHDAAHRLELKDNSILFIENVGNLVCPAGFDLGERAKVAVLSVTEGEDKPLKYPHMFAAAKIMLINKVDLLPYVNFDVKACIANARRVNPKIEAIEVSATTGEGMEQWVEWLQHELEA
ncbi:MAG: hydrogenase nickel incorporation protein HypB [Saezia sp.]